MAFVSRYPYGLIQLPAPYRLAESYHNAYDRICHRTLLNIGFIDIKPDQLNTIKTMLNVRLNRRSSMFEVQDQQVVALADAYWLQLVIHGKVDVSDHAFEKTGRMIDVDTLRHKDAREVRAEWMRYQALDQLVIKKLLHDYGWSTEHILLALAQIISRSVHPPFRVSYQPLDQGVLLCIRDNGLLLRASH